MKQIYTARNDMDAHFLQGLLEQEGIKSVIQGEPLEGAWGNLAFSGTALPGVWVNEPDVERAAAIADDYAKNERRHDGDSREESPTGPTWKCPKCGEAVEDQFDVCWNCGTDRPGESDGELVPA